jgi:hypothetical protein
MKATAAISIAALVAALAVTPTIADDLNLGLGLNAGADVSSDDGDASADVGLGLDLNASAEDDDGDGGSLTVGGDVDVGVSAEGDDDDLDVDVGGNVDAGVSAGGDDGDLGVDTNVTGAIDASASDDSLDLNTRLELMLKLINESDYDDSSFSAWADATSTTVVNTDDIFDADGQAKIDAALQANLDEHDDLNAAINANASLKAWLESEGIDAASVIAIDVSADGSVDVYEG